MKRCIILLISGAGQWPNCQSLPSWRSRTHTSAHLVCHYGSPIDDFQTDWIVAANQESPDSQSQRHLMFSGVGRLYQEPLADMKDTDLNEELDPRLLVLDRLHRSTVCVIGLGGVGSWAAEALCRSGVGNLILIDLDDICISNTNRQLHATSVSIGQMKIDEMRRRLLHINPHCSVTNIHEFVTESNVHEILDSMLPNVDIVLDAIDSSQAKTALIAACVQKKIPIVTCGAAAGKKDPTQVFSTDLARVNGDELLSSVRRNLRKSFGFSQGKKFHELKGKLPKKWKIPAVYSAEETKVVSASTHDIGSPLRKCDSALGTACFVTGTFGFVAAGQVVDMIARNKFMRPSKQ